MNNQNWKTKILLIGGILGALTGLGAAFIIIQRAEQENVRPSLTPGDGVKMGLGVLGLLRMLADTGRD